MTTRKRISKNFSIRLFFALLTLILLSFGAASYRAQNNSDGANANAGNLNANANRNGAANLNTNVNRNANANANANTNVNANANADQTNNSNSNTKTFINQNEEDRKNALSLSYWYFALVSLMFAVVLIPFALTIMKAVQFSRSTYRNPLGMPDGSLRAMLAYTLVAFLGFYILSSVLSLSEFKPPEFLLGIVATVIGFYFGSRSSEEKAAGTRTGGIIQGTVTDRTGAPAGSANVELSQANGTKFILRADANGKYKFENVQPGNYNLQATLPGHNPSQTAQLQVTGGATQNVNLSLT